MVDNTERLIEINEMIDTAKSGYDAHEQDFILQSMQYQCLYSDDQIEDWERRGKSHIFIPSIKQKIDKMHTSMMAAYFTNADLVAIEPDDPEDSGMGGVAEAISAAIKYYTRHKIVDVYNSMSTGVMTQFINGTTVFRCYWDSRINAPKIDNIELRDLWFDPCAKTINDCQYVVHRMYLTLEELEKLRGFDSFSAFEIPSAAGDYNTYNSRQVRKYQRYEIFDIYERSGDGWTISTRIGNSLPRDNMPLNDGLPIFVGNILPTHVRQDELDIVRVYGQSPIDTLLPLQSEMNFLRNQINDAVRQSLDPKMMAREGAILDPMALKRGPGSIIKVNDLNGIKELDSPNIQEAMALVQQTDLEMQETSGITSYNTGTDSAKLNDTATGISIISSEANQKLEQYIRAFNETCFEPMMWHMALLIWRYGDDRFFDGINIARDEDPALYVHAQTGLGATNPTQKLNAIREAMPALAQLGEPMGMRKLMREYLGALGIKNTEEYVTDEQTTAPDTQGGGIPAAGQAGANAAGEDGGIPGGNAGDGGLESFIRAYQNANGITA